MLQYGKDNFSGGPPDRATGNNIPSVKRIGLSQPDGANFTMKRPSDWGTDNSVDWLTNDDIIGGTSSGSFASHNSVKGALGLNGELDCRQGDYLIAFIHIGHGSGNGGTVIPRYDMYIRYNHNVNGYGGSDGSGVEACEGGFAPESQSYVNGATAKAYKSQTTSSTDTAYKTSTAMRAGTTSSILFNNSSGKDQTGLLAEGSNPSWLFDNIYFPYNGPTRQGTAESTSTNPNLNAVCCDPSLGQGTSGANIYNSQYCRSYRAEGLCGNRGGGGFGGGPGGVRGAGSIGDAYDFNIR
jgi:hypothetical protein